MIARDIIHKTLFEMDISYIWSVLKSIRQKIMFNKNGFYVREEMWKYFSLLIYLYVYLSFARIERYFVKPLNNFYRTQYREHASNFIEWILTTWSHSDIFCKDSPDYILLIRHTVHLCIHIIYIYCVTLKGPD